MEVPVGSYSRPTGAAKDQIRLVSKVTQLQTGWIRITQIREIHKGSKGHVAWNPMHEAHSIKQRQHLLRIHPDAQREVEEIKKYVFPTHQEDTKAPKKVQRLRLTTRREAEKKPDPRRHIAKEQGTFAEERQIRRARSQH